jgi:hypothetical protein
MLATEHKSPCSISRRGKIEQPSAGLHISIDACVPRRSHRIDFSNPMNFGRPLLRLLVVPTLLFIAAAPAVTRRCVPVKQNRPRLWLARLISWCLPLVNENEGS